MIQVQLLEGRTSEDRAAPLVVALPRAVDGIVVPGRPLDGGIP